MSAPITTGGQLLPSFSVQNLLNQSNSSIHPDQQQQHSVFAMSYSNTYEGMRNDTNLGVCEQRDVEQTSYRHNQVCYLAPSGSTPSTLYSRVHPTYFESGCPSPSVPNRYETPVMSPCVTNRHVDLGSTGMRRQSCRRRCPVWKVLSVILCGERQSLKLVWIARRK